MCVGIEAAGTAQGAALHPEHRAPARTIGIATGKELMNPQHVVAHGRSTRPGVSLTTGLLVATSFRPTIVAPAPAPGPPRRLPGSSGGFPLHRPGPPPDLWSGQGRTCP